MDEKQIKKHLKKIALKPFSFWMKYYGIFLILFFILLSGWGAYILLENVNGKTWNDERRQQYMSSQKKDIDLKKENFQKAIDAVKERRTLYEKDFQIKKDIFAE